VKDKLDTCLQQVQEFLNKFVASTKLVNTNIKSILSKIESLENKYHDLSLKFNVKIKDGINKQYKESDN